MSYSVASLGKPKGGQNQRRRSLEKEIKIWHLNKVEERKMTQGQKQVDRQMVSKRKTHLMEKDLINKEMKDKVYKTTPSADEYLMKSSRRYEGWRERERERLDRRYRGVYKSYQMEYPGGKELLNPQNTGNNDEYYVTDLPGDKSTLSPCEAVAIEELQDNVALEIRRLSDQTSSLSSQLAKTKLSSDTGHYDLQRRRFTTGSVPALSELQKTLLQNISQLDSVDESHPEEQTENEKLDGVTPIPPNTPEKPSTPPTQKFTKNSRQASVGNVELPTVGTGKRFSRRPSVPAIPMYDGGK